jgi:hypothetical protein
MGYFEGITDGNSYFKTDKEGNTLFYPWGILGKGYILPENRKAKFRSIIKKYLQISLPMDFAIIIFLKWWFIFCFVLPVYLCGYTIWIKKLTKDFAVSAEKLTINEYTTNAARSKNLTTLWICEIIFILGVIAGVFIIIKSPKDWFTGILSILGCGFISYIGGKMIKSKKIKSHNESLHEIV